MTIDNLSEMIALNKTLNHLRFGDTNGEIQEMVFSSLIVDFHLKLIDNLREEYKKINVDMPNGFGYIEEYPHFFNSVVGHIRSLDSWQNYNDTTKKDIIELIIKSYKLKESTLNYLADYK